LTFPFIKSVKLLNKLASLTIYVGLKEKVTHQKEKNQRIFRKKIDQPLFVPDKQKKRKQPF
jgi:hypothetical protein